MRGEAHAHGLIYAYDRAKQALMLEMDRPIALREAILACQNGGTVSVIGVYAGFIDKFPMGSVMIKTGQCHVQRYMKPLLERIARGDIDPSMVITHRMPLDQAPRDYAMFRGKEDNCEKVVLKPHYCGASNRTQAVIAALWAVNLARSTNRTRAAAPYLDL